MKPFWARGKDCYPWVDDPFLRGSVGTHLPEEIIFEGVETGAKYDQEGNR